jgi:hypothetical protein
VRFDLALRGLALRGLALGGVALAVCAVAGVQIASAAPRSGSPDGPRPSQVATTGDCELAGVTCRPPLPGSCTGYTSQSTPPATIRVLLRNGDDPVIATVPFQTYVDDVLPNEWIASWDGEAIKAGAIAVKSYAWYWVTHFGGYLNGDKTQCFDVTDDTDFQKYVAGSAATRTDTVIQQTWPAAARVDGQILQTFYRSYLSSPTEGCGFAANGTTMSQYGTQACSQANTGNKYNVILGKYYYPGLQLATGRQLHTPHDFQFLQTSTRVSFAAGIWRIDDGYSTTFHFGITGDLPTVTTAGDGFARIGVYRPSTHAWYTGSPTGTIARKITFGATGDIPVQAQYAGLDHPTVLAVFRPSTGTWYEASSTGAVTAKIRYGQRGDIPVPGHYTSSATDQLAVFRPSTGIWFVRGSAPVRFGTHGDIPVPADYDGSGTTDIAVYRPSTHRFYVRGHASVAWGLTGDLPVTGDFTGDGKADLAVYRPSTHTWYVRGGTSRVWGVSGDTPIGRGPYHD